MIEDIIFFKDFGIFKEITACVAEDGSLIGYKE
jgi:hypothetical protein